MRFPASLLRAASGAAAALLLAACAGEPGIFTPRSERELTAFDLEAVQASELARLEKIQEAEAIYSRLLADNNVSSPLYGAELAMLRLRRNDRDGAVALFKQTLGRWENAIDAESEKKAAGLFSGEINKVFHGESGERATLCAILGLLLLESGDDENALACFKSGLLFDAEVANSMYSSDYPVLLYCAARLAARRGDAESALKLDNLYADAMLGIHPELLDVIDARQALFFRYRMAKRQSDLTLGSAQAFEKDDAAIAAELRSAALAAAPGPFRPYLEAVATDEDAPTPEVNAAKSLLAMPEAEQDRLRNSFDSRNTAAILNSIPRFSRLANDPFLLAVLYGWGPAVSREGSYGELRRTDPPLCSADALELRIDGKRGNHLFDELGDVFYQISTRGVRKVDILLKDKAETKRTTQTAGTILLGVGLALMQSGDLILAGVGCGFLCLGGITHGVAYLMTPTADIRHWRSMPSQILLCPLSPPHGEFTASLLAYRQGLLIGVAGRTFAVGAAGSAAVLSAGDTGRGFCVALEKQNRELGKLALCSAARSPEEASPAQERLDALAQALSGDPDFPQDEKKALKRLNEEFQSAMIREDCR